MIGFAAASCVQAFQAYPMAIFPLVASGATAGSCNDFFFLHYCEGCGDRKKCRRGLSLRTFCGRAMKEDGDPLDASLPLLAGLMLETLGDLEEAAVR